MFRKEKGTGYFSAAINKEVADAEGRQRVSR
jgi:hypothetical protein